jgi:hypothetical protein
MQIVTGKVVDGKVVVSLPEGTVVTVLARDADETFELSEEMEQEIRLSAEEADRGNILSIEQALERLRRIA